jgi:hypothetical protein
MAISKELLDGLLKDCARPESLRGHAGLMKELKVTLTIRMQSAALTIRPHRRDAFGAWGAAANTA